MKRHEPAVVFAAGARTGDTGAGGIRRFVPALVPSSWRVEAQRRRPAEASWFCSSPRCSQTQAGLSPRSGTPERGFYLVGRRHSVRAVSCLRAFGVQRTARPTRPAKKNLHSEKGSDSFQP